MKKILLTISAGLICFFISCNDKTETADSQDHPMKQKNLEASRMVTKAFETGDPGGIDSVVASDYVDHTDRGDMNRDSLKTMITMIRKEFPDMKTEVIKEMADDDYVFSLMRFTGTSNGAMGMPKGPYDMHSMHVMRFKDGKAVEHWEYMEPREMMKMMGTQPGMDKMMDTTKRK